MAARLFGDLVFLCAGPPSALPVHHQVCALFGRCRSDGVKLKSDLMSAERNRSSIVKAEMVRAFRVGCPVCFG